MRARARARARACALLRKTHEHDQQAQHDRGEDTQCQDDRENVCRQIKHGALLGVHDGRHRIELGECAQLEDIAADEEDEQLVDVEDDWQLVHEPISKGLRLLEQEPKIIAIIPWRDKVEQVHLGALEFEKS